MSHTSYQWTLTDFALWFAGAIPVPIYETSSPAQMSWILTDSQAVAILLEDRSLTPKLDEIRDQSAFLRQVWHFDDDSLDNLVRLGKEISDQALEDRRHAAKLDDLATLIIYKVYAPPISFSIYDSNEYIILFAGGIVENGCCPISSHPV